MHIRRVPVRCSIRNWAFFMSIGDHFRDLTKMIPDTKLTAVFSHLFCSSDASILEFGDLYGKQAAVRVFVNLPVDSQTQVCFMNKEVTLGTPAVPAHETDFVTKLRDQLNRVLPAECQIKTVQDAWYAGAIIATVATFIFPPALLALAYCVIQAKKKGGER